MGFFAARKWDLGERIAGIFSKIILTIAVPGYMMASLTTRFDRQQLLEIFANIHIPLLVTLLTFAIGIILAKGIRLPKNRKGAFIATISISNTIFVGLPVNTGLFGDESLPYVFICFMVNVVLFWTLGAGVISKDGDVKIEGNPFLHMMKQVFTPPMMAFLTAILFVWFGWHLPDIILIPCRHMGNMMTPLSMLYLGIVLAEINLKHIRLDKSMILIVIVRYVIAPFSMFIVVTLLGAPILMQKVFLIQTIMPAMSITAVISKKVGGDHHYATVITTMTTVATLLILPVYIALFSIIMK